MAVRVKTELLSSTFHFRFNYSEAKDVEINESIDTPQFQLGPYKWLIKFFPKLVSVDGDAIHVGLCLKITTGHSSAMIDYELGALNEFRRPTSTWLRSTAVFDRDKDQANMWVINRTDFERDHVRSDEFIAVCSISISEGPSPILNNKAIKGYPINLEDDLRLLFERSADGDFIFQVEEVDIPAHKAIVEARSPVLRAELSQEEVKLTNRMVVPDMEPRIFKTLLYFMYTNTLSVDYLLGGDSSRMNKSPVDLYEPLIVASLRYGVLGLTVLCEHNLMRSISKENVIKTLSLAEEHKFSLLKELCLKFIADGKYISEMALDFEYINLGLKFPMVLLELKKRLGM